MTAHRNVVGLLAAESRGPQRSSSLSDSALQNRGHYAARTVGTYCIYDGLPLTFHSLSKQLQHAALKANKPHTVSSAFPRTGQD